MLNCYNLKINGPEYSYSISSYIVYYLPSQMCLERTNILNEYGNNIYYYVRYVCGS